MLVVGCWPRLLCGVEGFIACCRECVLLTLTCSFRFHAYLFPPKRLQCDIALLKPFGAIHVCRLDTLRENLVVGNGSSGGCGVELEVHF